MICANVDNMLTRGILRQVVGGTSRQKFMAQQQRQISKFTIIFILGAGAIAYFNQGAILRTIKGSVVFSILIKASKLEYIHNLMLKGKNCQLCSLIL